MYVLSNMAILGSYVRFRVCSGLEDDFSNFSFWDDDFQVLVLVLGEALLFPNDWKWWFCSHFPK